MYSLLHPNKGEVTVTRHTLLGAGFYFSYFTQMQEMAIGMAYYCYDFCYVAVNENHIVIKQQIQ